MFVRILALCVGAGVTSVFLNLAAPHVFLILSHQTPLLHSRTQINRKDVSSDASPSDAELFRNFVVVVVAGPSLISRSAQPCVDSSDEGRQKGGPKFIQPPPIPEIPF